MKDNDIRQAILEVEEIKLKAQLRVVREALRGKSEPLPGDDTKRISQIEYVYQLLKNETTPLHVKDIISKCKDKFGIDLDRESIVSALLKKVYRMDRFIKTGPNTFGLSEYREMYRSQQKEG